MPCLIITGYPSSGKTSIAEMISERALKHHSKTIQRTMIINEESIYSSSTRSINNNSNNSSSSNNNNNNNNNNDNRYPPEHIKQKCYHNSNAEKETRAALKTEFDRYASTASSTKTLVILDSLNYIKGYRYELHCISKAVGERHGIVWVVCPPKLAFQWNQNRIKQYETNRKESKNGNDEEKITNYHRNNSNEEENEKDFKLFYTEEMLEGLMKRYEPPDNRNRWDKPLYRIELSTLIENAHSNDECKDDNNQSMSASNSVAKDVLEKSVYNMHSLSDAIEDNTSKSSNSNSTTTNDEMTNKSKLEDRIDTILDAFLECKPLKEGLSTQKPIVAASNVSSVVPLLYKITKFHFFQLSHLFIFTYFYHFISYIHERYCIKWMQLLKESQHQYAKHNKIYHWEVHFLSCHTYLHQQANKKQLLFIDESIYQNYVVGKDNMLNGYLLIHPMTRLNEEYRNHS